MDSCKIVGGVGVWSLSTEHFTQCHAKGKDITQTVIMTTPNNFRCHVDSCSSIGSHTCLHWPGEAKITDFGLRTELREKNVSRFKIAMDDWRSLTVKIRQCRC